MTNPATKSRDALVAALARLQGHARSLADVKAQATVRAREQLDSMPRAIHTVEGHVQADAGGGILAHRRLRVLQEERRRLAQIVDGIAAKPR